MLCHCESNDCINCLPFSLSLVGESICACVYVCLNYIQMSVSSRLVCVL